MFASLKLRLQLKSAPVAEQQNKHTAASDHTVFGDHIITATNATGIELVTYPARNTTKIGFFRFDE